MSSTPTEPEAWELPEGAPDEWGGPGWWLEYRELENTEETDEDGYDEEQEWQ